MIELNSKRNKMHEWHNTKMNFIREWSRWWLVMSVLFTLIALNAHVSVQWTNELISSAWHKMVNFPINLFRLSSSIYTFSLVFARDFDIFFLFVPKLNWKWKIKRKKKPFREFLLFHIIISAGAKAETTVSFDAFVGAVVVAVAVCCWLLLMFRTVSLGCASTTEQNLIETLRFKTTSYSSHTRNRIECGWILFSVYLNCSVSFACSLCRGVVERHQQPQPPSCTGTPKQKQQ